VSVQKSLAFMLLFAWLLLSSVTRAAVSIIPDPPEVAAKAHILVDFHTGMVFAERNADERLEPASLTKLMTAYTVFQELKSGDLKPGDTAMISRKAWRTGGSKMFVKVNTEVAVEDLLQGMIVQSGNDASVALAEHVAGGEDAFADLMNHNAKQLGMKNTHFVNATGLPADDHYSTARDLAILARALIRDFPDYYAYYSQKEFTYQPPRERHPITQKNRNKLLWRDKRVDGMKTGYTRDAGYCLVASAKDADMRLISVVLGTKTVAERFRYSQALLTYGFRFYETHRVYAANKPLTKVRIWKGDVEELPLGTERDIYVTVPRGRFDKLKAAMQVEPRILAPVAKGAKLGKVRISLGDKTLVDTRIVSLREVPEGNLWRQLVDSGLLWWEE
jgi:D-alanyl-D-alanine carboxypeptidase (penicillin-binding protein 5/6)